MKIIFLGFMELGWEISRWAPYINGFIKENPEINVTIITLKGRIDLYKGYKDHTEVEIDDLYTKKKPQSYWIHGIDNIYSQINAGLLKLYPKALIIQPPMNPNKRMYVLAEILKYSIAAKYKKAKEYTFTHIPLTSEFDVNFQPREMNKIVIDGLLTENDKPVVVIAPRHRLDYDRRNWKISYWHRLFDLLEPDYKILIAGSAPSYIRGKINLEDYNREGTSTIGLTVEAIRAADLVIGQESSIPLLAMLMKKSLISWGMREFNKENVFRSDVHYFDCPDFDITPDTIYEKALEVLKSKSA